MTTTKKGLVFKAQRQQPQPLPRKDELDIIHMGVVAAAVAAEAMVTRKIDCPLSISHQTLLRKFLFLTPLPQRKTSMTTKIKTTKDLEKESRKAVPKVEEVVLAVEAERARKLAINLTNKAAAKAKKVVMVAAVNPKQLAAKNPNFKKNQSKTDNFQRHQF